MTRHAFQMTRDYALQVAGKRDSRAGWTPTRLSCVRRAGPRSWIRGNPIELLAGEPVTSPLLSRQEEYGVAKATDCTKTGAVVTL
jgi:hypothetical protein